MKKLALAAAVSVVGSPAFAATYWAAALSGTVSDPQASFSTVVATGTQQSWYVDFYGGSASNRTQPAIQKYVDSGWAFDFTNPSAVAFSGELNLGTARTQTVGVLDPNFGYDGRVSYTGVKYLFSGVGAYNEATRTFTYNFINPVANGGGGSIYSEAAPATCQNGVTWPIGNVCTAFGVASRDWEGLILNFVFDEGRNYFAGSLQGIETYGFGASRTTTVINWQINSEVPVPGSAWLLGSSLLGLAGIRRRRRK